MYQYTVSIQTLLGPRYGFLVLHIDNDKDVTGFLQIFNHCEPVSGTMEQDGHCVLSGCMKTLFHTIPYQAEGYANASKISLLLSGNLRGEKKQFPMTGTSSLQRKELEL